MSESERIRVGDNVTVSRRGKRGIWTADYWHDRQHRRRSLKTTNKKFALQRATKLSAELADGSYERPLAAAPVRAAADEYVAHLETQGRAPKTIVKYRAALDNLVEFLTQHKVTTLSQMTHLLFDKFRAGRLGLLHRKTVYCESIIVKQLYKWAKRRRLIRENPLADYELEKPPREEAACPGVEQVDRILAALDDRRRAQVSMLAFTGMRSGELERLQPIDVDLERRWIHIRSRVGGETKNRKSRKIPIHDRLLAILQPIVARSGPRLFTEPPSEAYPEGDNKLNTKRLNAAFQRAAGRLEMTVGRKQRGLVVHSLRHFFETFTVNAGIPQRVVDAWMGHSSDKSMASVYYRLSDEDSQAFMKRVPFGDGVQATEPRKEKR